MAKTKKSVWWIPFSLIECAECGASFRDYTRIKDLKSCPGCGWTNKQQAEFDKRCP